MEIFKVIGVGIIGAILAMMLKSDKSEYAIMVTIATGVIILTIMLTTLADVIAALDNVVAMSGIDDKLFGGLIKIIGIGYLTEYAGSLCTDLGGGNIARKIQLAGKLTIFMMALPIITALIQTIRSILP